MKPFATVAVVIFSVMAIVHLIRLAQGWEVVVGGFSVPVAWSAPAAIILGGLAFLLWRESRR